MITVSDGSDGDQHGDPGSIEAGLQHRYDSFVPQRVALTLAMIMVGFVDCGC